MSGGYTTEVEEVASGMLDAFALTRLRHPAVRIAWWRGSDVGTDALRAAFRDGYEAWQPCPVPRPRQSGGSKVLPGNAKQRKELLAAFEKLLDGGETSSEELIAVGDLMSQGIVATLAQSADHSRSMLAPSSSSGDESVGDAVRVAVSRLGLADNLADVLKFDPVERKKLKRCLPAPSLDDLPLMSADLNGRRVPTETLRFIAGQLSISAAAVSAQMASREDLDRTRDFFRNGMTGQVNMLDASVIVNVPETVEADLALFVPMMLTAIQKITSKM